MGGQNGSSGGIAHPQLLFRCGRMDARVYHRGAHQQLLRKEFGRFHRSLPRFLPIVEAGAVAHCFLAGYSLHHCKGSGKGHREIIEDYDADAVHHHIGVGGLLGYATRAQSGIEFLLKPDFSKVDGSVFLGAMGQAFFSLSLGMGCLCTYASYFGEGYQPHQNSFQRRSH